MYAHSYTATREANAARCSKVGSAADNQVRAPMPLLVLQLLFLRVLLLLMLALLAAHVAEERLGGAVEISVALQQTVTLARAWLWQHAKHNVMAFDQCGHAALPHEEGE